MKVTLVQEFLNGLVSSASGVAPKKSVKPINTHVLLTADKETNTLSIAAHDEEMNFVGRITSEVEEGGSLAISGDDLNKIVKNLPNKPVKIESDDENSECKIRCQKIKYKLQSLSSDEFPTLPDIDTEKGFTISAANFARFIDNTLYASSSEETRFYLGGVYVEQVKEGDVEDGGLLRGVATDGHRLALIDVDAPKKFELGAGQIIPKKFLGEVRKVLSLHKERDDLKFGFHDRLCWVDYRSKLITTLLVEGSFPDYNQVIPKEGRTSTTCRVEKLNILTALKRISVMTDKTNGGFRFELSEGVLNISSQNTGRGSANQDIETISVDGGDIEVGFNCAYFIEALSKLESDYVDIRLTNNLSPCVIIPCDSSILEKDEEKETLYTPRKDNLAVVMPMRL